MSNKKNTKTAIVIGSGLVGSLWSVYLNRAGYKVKTFERRSDMRKNRMSAGKSINLAMSFRGWKALDEVGIGDEIRKIAIPMYGRTMHDINGNTTYQPYGINNQAIWSVSRGDINCTLMDISERDGDTEIFFSEECVGGDLQKGIVNLRNTQTGNLSIHQADAVFGTDGAFSAIRYNAMQKLDRFDYSQKYIEDGYREILLPANADGSYKLEKNTLHIWPRGRFMLIALPNFDGSFTCTLFMPFDGHEHCFNNLTSKEKVNNFFQSVFPDFFEMMPNIANAWEEHPLSSLAIIRCFPWTHGKFALMGDAAHATVPFFGQGMNAGFEDCSVLASLMKTHNENWSEVFNAYQIARKPNGDAVQDLSLLNYIVMRDKVADPGFLLQQKVERRMAELYPGKYFPMYSMVSFSEIEYHIALNKGTQQDLEVQGFIQKHQINNQTNAEKLDELIHAFYNEKIKT